jgi:hypothetical protein
VSADFYADLEIREHPDTPWRFVVEAYLGSGSRLDGLLFPEDPDDVPGSGVSLETTRGLPTGFRRSAELQRALERVRARATVEDLGAEWLGSQEEILTVAILDRFDPSHEDLSCWTTLDALERYPWDIAFPPSDPIPRGLSNALSFLKAAGDGQNARLVICRLG